MGWTYGYENRNAAVEAEAGEAWSGEGPRGDFTTRRIARRFVGNTHYSLHEILHSDGERERFVLVTLLRRSGRVWGAKSTTHEMGPYYFDVPLSWLDGLTTVGASGRHWVESVRAYQAGRKGLGAPLAARPYLHVELGVRSALETEEEREGRDLAFAWRRGDAQHRRHLARRRLRAAEG